ncbi:hypothetical protein ABT026_23785 [Streptomyces sp. NPDC002734]|uniref:hypothetical protein n=1 Tax=Streptomyces sp. NPDC002734 TaxID=3154426 RepID=UPI003333690D
MEKKPMRIRVMLSASAAAALLALTGCSADGSSRDGASSGAAEEGLPLKKADAALTGAVEKYTAAYFGGDPATAFGMLSARCRYVVGDEAQHQAEGEDEHDGAGAHEVGKDGTGGQAAEHGGPAYEAAVARMAEKYGPRQATGVKVREDPAVERDDRVFVEYEVEGVPDFGHDQPWLKERGDWKYDAC